MPLIIDCSPVLLDTAEMFSTVYSTTHAQSIKNTVRMNAELLPVELRNSLPNAQTSAGGYQKKIDTMDVELAVWRAWGNVEPSEYAEANAQAGGTSINKKLKLPAFSTATNLVTSSATTSRSGTPVTLVIGGPEGA